MASVPMRAGTNLSPRRRGGRRGRSPAGSGGPPPPGQPLVQAVRLRVLAKRVGAAAVVRESAQYTIRLRPAAHLPEPVQRRGGAAPAPPRAVPPPPPGP